MGYNTSFTITIVAPTLERKRELAEAIVNLARIGSDKDEALFNFDTFEVLQFDAKWYEWKHDVQGSWWDAEIRDVREGLKLNEGESLSLEGYGDDDDDVWRAFVSRRKFSIEHCDHVEWTNKRELCDNCDSDDEDKCPGCQGCADRVPVY